jgi:hypothetical protein
MLDRMDVDSSRAARGAGHPSGGSRPTTAVLRRILPLILLVGFAAGALQRNPVALDERQADGLFYYQIAQNVAAGEGLLTGVSLFGQGLRELPSTTTVQPLWPLLLGWTGRSVGLDRAAAGLPELFYLVSLILLYVLANRIGRCLGAEILVSVRGVPVLDLGSVLVAILGANSVYRAYTSLAYSEGLAMTLLFGALLAMPGLETRRVMARAGLAGLLAGLAYLARSQLILVPLGMAAALALVGIRDREMRGAALACLVCALAPVGVWIAFLLSALGPFPPAVLIDFAAYRETPALPEFALTVIYSGVIDRVRDLFASFAVAFDPRGFSSYVTSFGFIAYAVPAALVVFGWGLARGRGNSARLLEAFDRSHLPALSVCLVAGAALAPVHAAHMTIWIEWHFGWRHGVPFVLALAPAIAVLSRTGAMARALVLLAVVVGISAPATTPANYLLGPQRPTWPAEQSLMRWIDEHPRPPVLLAIMARSLAARSRGVAHQLDCGGPDHVRVQLELLPVSYLVVYASDLRTCPELAGLGSPGLERVKRFGRGAQEISVLVLGAGGARPAPSPDAPLDPQLKIHPNG